MLQLATTRPSVDGMRQLLPCSCTEPSHFLHVDPVIDESRYDHSHVFFQLGLDPEVSLRVRLRLLWSVLTGRWALDNRVVELDIDQVRRLHRLLTAVLQEVDEGVQSGKHPGSDLGQLFSGRAFLINYLEERRKEQELSLREWLSYLAHLHRTLVSVLADDPVKQGLRLEKQLGQETATALGKSGLTILALLSACQELQEQALIDYREEQHLAALNL